MISLGGLGEVAGEGDASGGGDSTGGGAVLGVGLPAGDVDGLALGEFVAWFCVGVHPARTKAIATTTAAKATTPPFTFPSRTLCARSLFGVEVFRHAIAKI